MKIADATFAIEHAVAVLSDLDVLQRRRDDPPPPKQFITSFEGTKGAATVPAAGENTSKSSLSFRDKVKLALMEIT
eukprot:gene30437-39680_t